VPSIAGEKLAAWGDFSEFKWQTHQRILMMARIACGLHVFPVDMS
jgi:hypothetical protein